MVQAIGLLLPASLGSTITVAGVTLATSAGLTIAGSIVNLLGGALIQSAFAPDLPDPIRPENIKINTKNEAAPRLRHYGRVRVGGNVVFHRARNGISYRVIVHGHGEIDEVERYFLDADPVDINALGYVTTEKYQLAGGQLTALFGDATDSRVRLLSRLGKVPADVYQEISAIWAEWTQNHRLDGLWTTLIIAESVPPEHYRRIYPNNEPGLQAEARTSRCFDPRSGATHFTENPALIVADFLRHPDGFNRPQAVDQANIAAEADICDVQIPLAHGGTEPRYRIGGSYQLNERPQAVLARMLAACGGRMRLTPDGRARLDVGAERTPTMTLRYADLLELADIQPGPDNLDRYNHLPARYVDQSLGFVEVDAQPFIDQQRIAEDGEEMVGPVLAIQMCPSHVQARRVMKIRMARDNPALQMRGRFKPSALPAIYEGIVRLEIPEIGITGDFEIDKYGIAMDSGLLTGITLQLRQIDPDAFRLTTVEQGDRQTLPLPDTPAGIPLPKHVAAAGNGVSSGGGAAIAGIAVAWESPASDALVPVVQYAPAGSGQWVDVVVSGAATNVQITGLTDGAQYDVSVAFKTPSDVVGSAEVISGVTANTNVNAISAPTLSSVTDAGGGVAQVSVTAPADDRTWKIRIERDGAIVTDVYIQPGASLSIDDQSGPGTFTWTARTIAVSGDVSAPSSSITQTIT